MAGPKPTPLRDEELIALGWKSGTVKKNSAAPSPPRAYPWKTMVALTVSGLALGFLAGGIWPWKTPDTTPSYIYKGPRPGAIALQPGPWGTLDALPIYIEPPEEFLSIRMVQESDRRWRFEGFTPDQLTTLFQTADLTDAQRAELLDTSKWQQDAQALYVSPSKDLILSLSPQARKHIYAALTADSNNIYSLLRCSYPADRFDAFFSHTGLPDETIALVKKLSYPHGHLIFFCDIPLVLDTLQTNDQKVRLVKTLLRKSTLLLRLHITPDTNIDDLVRYWSRAGQGINIEPLLKSLGEVPNGTGINVSLLLPPRPAGLLYDYPYPSNRPEDLHKDCHYTALNFFRDPPDPRFTDPNVVRQTLLNDYYPVLSDPRYGDVLVLERQDGSIIHSCIFIADNVVYTKNSANFRDPFIFMTIPDMVDTFEAQIPEGQSLTLQYYRDKYY